MSNPNITEDSKATQWKPGQSGNPAGKPKGAKHLSTWIQEFMNDEEFELLLDHPIHGVEKFKGAPVKAIIRTAMRRAANGDSRWASWLADHGWAKQIETSTEVVHKYEDMTDEELENIIKARQNRIS